MTPLPIVWFLDEAFDPCGRPHNLWEAYELSGSHLGGPQFLGVAHRPLGLAFRPLCNPQTL